MHRLLKKEIKDLLTRSTPKMNLSYYKGQYAKVINGLLQPITKETALDLLNNQPNTELMFFYSDPSENLTPVELKGFKVVKNGVDCRETMETLLKLRSGISRILIH